MSMLNIVAGFRTKGICPFNRFALQSTDTSKNSLAEKTGLKFIPLYSPMHKHHPSSAPISTPDLQMTIVKEPTASPSVSSHLESFDAFTAEEHACMFHETLRGRIWYS